MFLLALRSHAQVLVYFSMTTSSFVCAFAARPLVGTKRVCGLVKKCKKQIPA